MGWRIVSSGLHDLSERTRLRTHATISGMLQNHQRVGYCTDDVRRVRLSLIGIKKEEEGFYFFPFVRSSTQDA